jgi:hypothetical protein
MSTKNQKPKSKNPKLEIYNLTVARVDRSKKTLESWRDAMIAAESPTFPNRRRLYDLYAELELDTHLASVREKRILNVLSGNIVFFDKSGKENDVISGLIAQPFFRSMCADILDSRSWGHSLLFFDCLTVTPGELSNYIMVPRRNVIPERGLITRQTGDIDGISFLETPYCHYTISAGNTADLGLLNKAAPYIIYKKNTAMDWSTYNEVFGFPFRKVTYSGNDATVRRELEHMLDECHRASSAILPEEANLEFIQNQSNGANGFELFKQFMSICDKQVSKLYLGNTMTTDAEGGNYKGEVHEKAELRIADSDRHFLLSVLNTDFIRIMEIFGIPASGGWFAFNDTEELSLKDRVDIDIKLSAIIPIEPDYFYETYNIPKPPKQAEAPQPPKEEQPKEEKEEKEENPASPKSQASLPSLKSPSSLFQSPIFVDFYRLVSSFFSFFAKAPRAGA